MKFTLFLLPLLLAFTAPTKPTRVVFFGDSITEAGARPGGYITKIQDMLAKQNRAADYELIGKGIGGNKVYDLYLRMEDDVLALKPDVVVIYIGVNDVWHKSTSGTGTDAPKFVKFYEALIRKIQANGGKVILCTPAVIGERTDNSNEQDGDLNAYSTIIRELATKQNLPLIDLRKAFIDYNLQNNPTNKDRGVLTTDRVHLNEAGNQFVAELMLATLDKR
ncbi:SGNH/GDSL hydrolase family protein [Fibrella arboris]|uniref:SGNH/GDSL hydrolase family protein n=1 Tax=Fibrella arboris TaxID=3242486 RepID=UPI00351FB83F